MKIYLIIQMRKQNKSSYTYHYYGEGESNNWTNKLQ